MNSGSGRQIHQRFVQNVARLLQESWALTKRLPQLGNSSWRTECLELTQKHDNRLALHILKLDKEIHLMRYHGVWNYMQQYYQQRKLQLQPAHSNHLSQDIRQHSTKASSPLSSPQSQTPSSPLKQGKKAKIPFVITTSMKQALGDMNEGGLGYTVDQIKKLTPLKATLLLQHRVDPKDMESRLPQLVSDHEKQEEEEQRQLQEHLELERQKSLRKTVRTSTTVMHKKVVWYRVVEVMTEKSKDSIHGETTVVEEVVGMHKTLEQAEEDRSLRQELALRNEREFPLAPNQQRTFMVVSPEQHGANNSGDDP